LSRNRGYGKLCLDRKHIADGRRTNDTKPGLGDRRLLGGGSVFGIVRITAATACATATAASRATGRGAADDLGAQHFDDG
jgi:hypothetical protein